MGLSPAFSNKNVPIAISCSNRYVPYVSVLLQSIIENSTPEHNYDIIILNKDYSEHNKSILKSQCSAPNFSLRFFDVNEYISGKSFYTKNLSVEAYFRMFLIDIMNDYDKVLYLDVDIITLCDVAELYEIDIKNNYIAASVDVNIVGSYISGNHWKPYIDEVLRLKNPEQYVQSGVMILNLKEMRKDFSLDFITEICTANEWRLFDQDILNSICQGRIYDLDMRYNTINGMEGRMENIKKWTPKYLQDKWFKAREMPKIVHYVGKKKPWLSFEAEYAEYFWDYAQRSKFYHFLIVGRIVQIEMQAADKKINELKREVAALKTAAATAPVAAAKPAVSAAPAITAAPKITLPEAKPCDAVLIRCQSVYQLFNAVNLVANVLTDRKVDLVLAAATDFSQYVEPLKRSRLFRNVYMSADTPNTYFEWRAMEKKDQQDIYINPEKYIFPLENDPDYSDYYIAVADEYSKIFYYAMLKKGCYPLIHMFEDGMNSYLLDNKAGCETDFIDHSVYGKHCFANKITSHYTYEPTVIFEQDKTIRYERLPSIRCTKKTKKLFNSIFPSEPLPKQKYIFLEEAFYCDGIASTDVELVEQLAEMVGKENIIVKLHPRNDYDRFTPRGFTVMTASKAPFEMSILNANAINNVFVTVSSTAALTSGLVFCKQFISIELFRIMSLGKNVHVRNPKYLEFYKMLSHFINKDSLRLFTPASMDEFKEEIFYLEGGLE